MKPNTSNQLMGFAIALLTKFAYACGIPLGQWEKGTEALLPSRLDDDLRFALCRI